MSFLKSSWIGFVGFIGCIAVTSVHAQNITPELQKKLTMCTACHGDSGSSAFLSIPDLKWQNKDYMVNQLRHFRSEQRSDITMSKVAKLLSDEDIDAIAEYFYHEGSRQ